MAKTKYLFNPKTLNYEKFKLSSWVIVLRGIGVFSFSIIFCFIFFILFTKFTDTPVEKKLKSENTDLKAELDNINQRLEKLSKDINTLRTKDVSVYRSIYESSPVSEKSWQQFAVNDKKYSDLRKLPNSKLLIEINKQMDLLTKQIDIQGNSFDDLLVMASNKKDYLARIPAIQPISNQTLDRIGSGFGYRTDPFYRTQRLHAGIDFTAPKGTEVYATADGVIRMVKSEIWGYGQHIIIDHGSGFETLYGHLSKFIAKQGQSVKRGQLIGFVGSTGKSTAPHLHYEVHRDGSAINPAFFFYNDLTNEEYQRMLELSSSPNQSFD